MEVEVIYPPGPRPDMSTARPESVTLTVYRAVKNVYNVSKETMMETLQQGREVLRQSLKKLANLWHQCVKGVVNVVYVPAKKGVEKIQSKLTIAYSNIRKAYDYGKRVLRRTYNSARANLNNFYNYLSGYYNQYYSKYYNYFRRLFTTAGSPAPRLTNGYNNRNNNNSNGRTIINGNAGTEVGRRVINRNRNGHGTKIPARPPGSKIPPRRPTAGGRGMIMVPVQSGRGRPVVPVVSSNGYLDVRNGQTVVGGRPLLPVVTYDRNGKPSVVGVLPVNGQTGPAGRGRGYYPTNSGAGTPNAGYSERGNFQYRPTYNGAAPNGVPYGSAGQGGVFTNRNGGGGMVGGGGYPATYGTVPVNAQYPSSYGNGQGAYVPASGVIGSRRQGVYVPANGGQGTYGSRRRPGSYVPVNGNQNGGQTAYVPVNGNGGKQGAYVPVQGNNGRGASMTATGYGVNRNGQRGSIETGRSPKDSKPAVFNPYAERQSGQSQPVPGQTQSPAQGVLPPAASRGTDAGARRTGSRSTGHRQPIQGLYGESRPAYKGLTSDGGGYPGSDAVDTNPRAPQQRPPPAAASRSDLGSQQVPLAKQSQNGDRGAAQTDQLAQPGQDRGASSQTGDATFQSERGNQNFAGAQGRAIPYDEARAQGVQGDDATASSASVATQRRPQRRVPVRDFVWTKTSPVGNAGRAGHIDPAQPSDAKQRRTSDQYGNFRGRGREKRRRRRRRRRRRNAS